MSENQINLTQTFSRRARLEDFLDEDDKNCQNNNRYNNSNKKDDNIAKNQQEFGHKKRIKP
jgi:hypothetical protein